MATRDQQPPAEEQVLVSDDFEAELFWHKHRQTIFAVVALVVIAAVGITAWLVSVRQARLAAETLFAQAQNPTGWREVIAKYPKSAPAADAYFLLAESLREDGRIDESNQNYQRFLTTFPRHQLTGGARLGLATNFEVQGKDKEALETLRELQARDSSSYAASFAALMESRILIREGKLADAQKVLSNIVQTYPTSSSARVADSMRKELVLLLPAKAAQ